MVINAYPRVLQYGPTAANSGVSASQNQQEAPAAQQTQQQAPQAGTRNQQPGEGSDAAARVLENLTSSPEFTKKVLSKMGSGDQVTITVNGDQVLQIKNEGPSLMSRVIKGGQLFITAAAEEAANVVAADPAFAFKEAALGVRPQVASGLPDGAAALADNLFLPMLRTAALVLDGKKAADTWKNKDSDRVTKIIDTAHVVTDVVGLVGALGEKMIPSLGAAAGTMTAIGLAGDIAAYSYHVLQYLRERGQVNFHDDPNQQQAQKPPAQPQGVAA